MIDKLQVGEYCRTAGGRIFKVSEVETYGGCNYIPKDENKTLIVSAIVKHSFNLIDIIEEGDYVNGHLVVEHAYEKGRLFVSVVYIGGKVVTTSEDYSWELTKDNEDMIKSILTHERFESASYKVKEQ